MRYTIFFLFIVSFIISSSSFAQIMPLETVAKQAYIIDAQTGQVLFDKNGDEKMPTSSMSKTMSMYMVFEALKNGKITLDQEFPVSEKAWRMQGSKMFVPLGGMVKIEDLIRGVIVQSGNDATIVLAEGLAGTEDDFAIAMNAKAKELGMMNSNFVNASGWPDPNHYSTCHDLATLALALIKNFPEEYKYYSEIDFTYNNIKQGNRNPLLYKNIGADGIKTGHAEEAGYGLMGSAVRGDRRVVMVLNGMASMNERAQESTRLMEWALNNFTNTSILKTGMTVANAPVVMGVARTVPLIVQQDLIVTLPKMAGNSSVNAKAIFKGPLMAPVKKGQEIGIVRVEIANMNPIELPIVTGADVLELDFFPSLFEKLERMVFGDKIPTYATAP